MPTNPPLPGLDRLITVCQRHSLPTKLLPPLPSAPKQGELVLAEPFDPQLAAVYQRLSEAELGPLALCRPGSEWMDLIPWNERLREDGAVPFSAPLIFSWEMGFSLYYGALPRLAGAQGLQPVVHVNAYEAPYAVPVASSVDRFFDAYAQYLELMVVDPEYIHHGVSALHFPWDLTGVIARDEPLLRQVRAGSFDLLTNHQRVAVEWLQQLRATSPE